MPLMLLGHALQGLVFRKCGQKSKTSERNLIFANKTAGRERVKPGPGSPDLGFTPHFRKRLPEVCGKFRNPRARCSF